MSAIGTIGQNFDFPEGVTIIVPEQGRRVGVRLAPIPPGLGPDENFRPIRIVANVVLFDRDTDEILTRFDPPIEIDVRYHSSDLFEVARLARVLKLAYWNGTKWVVLDRDENKFTLLPPTTGMVGEVQISDWEGDPAISWGT